MADTVRFFLESMVPELEAMEEYGYFTKVQVRDIVRKRENFEYALKRRPPLKADFLRYIEYETSLIDYIKLKRAKLGIVEDKGKGTATSIRRCHTIYERATRKYKGDVRLWFAWLEFCKQSESPRQMSKVLTAALQLHPTHSALWGYSAVWEFEHNKNTTGARALMQQGLRVCKQDSQLWLDYFRMELVYAYKLRRRREVLGLDSQRKSHQAEESNTETELEGIEPVEMGEDALQAVLSGAIARVVAREGLGATDDSLGFCQQLLQVLSEVLFPGTEKIVEDIFAHLEANFGESPETWDLKARQLTGRCASTSEPNTESKAFEAAIQVYKEAVQKLPSARMFDLYLQFLQSQVGEKPGMSLKGKQRKIGIHALGVYTQAYNAGALSEAAAQDWCPLALRCGKVREALDALDRACTAFPQSLEIWKQRITLAAERLANQVNGADDFLELERLILEATQQVAVEQAPELWVQGYKTLHRLDVPAYRLNDQLVKALSCASKGPLRGGMGEAAAEAVRVAWDTEGADSARSLYQELLKLPPCGGSFYHGVLDLELSEQRNALSSAQIRAVFETAVSAYGAEDTELWVRYAKFSEAQGKGTGSIAWRATKELRDPDKFTQAMSNSFQ